MNRAWKPGVSEFRGLMPVPTAAILVSELSDKGEWLPTEIPSEYVDILTISMGLYSGMLNLSGMSRAVLQVSGYVMPQKDDEVIYH